jgi:hypothetical protein
MTEKTQHAECAVCKAPIHWGEKVVSIQRNLEHLNMNDDVIDVLDSVLLASLCVSCGERFPEGAIRLVFGDK